jgi:hypothetical protein
MSKSEKRIHPRTKVLRPHRCTCEGGVCEILDISIGGACVMTERAYEPGSIVRLSLSPPRLATVRWVNSIFGRFMVGVKFFT